MFAEATSRTPARALYCLPLQIGALRVGVLSLYRDQPGPLSTAELAGALLCADVAPGALLDLPAADPEVAQPQRWLTDGDLPRRQIHRATGMVMTQLGISAESALATLRAYAYVHAQPLEDVAVQVLTRRLRFPGSLPGLWPRRPPGQRTKSYPEPGSMAAVRPRALQEGCCAVHAVPMRLRTQIIGGLNLFSTQPGPLPPEDLRVSQALADVATISILHERALRRSKILAEQVQTALNNRVIIEQALGVLAERTGLSVSDVFTRLRAHDRRNRMRLSDLARGIVEGRPRPRHR